MTRGFPRLLAVCTAAAMVGLAAPAAPGTGAAAFAQSIPLSGTTIADLNAAFASGSLSSEQLVSLFLARIRAYDDQGPGLNAMLALNPSALETARALDAERMRSGPRSALHGIPVILKDNVDTHDMPTTAGSILLQAVRSRPTTPSSCGSCAKRVRSSLARPT